MIILWSEISEIFIVYQKSYCLQICQIYFNSQTCGVNIFREDEKTFINCQIENFDSSFTIYLILQAKHIMIVIWVTLTTQVMQVMLVIQFVQAVLIICLLFEPSIAIFSALGILDMGSLQRI